MINIRCILLLLVAASVLEGCRKTTTEEAKEEKKVDSMIQTDEQRADSMKKALGLE